MVVEKLVKVVACIVYMSGGFQVSGGLHFFGSRGFHTSGGQCLCQ